MLFVGLAENRFDLSNTWIDEKPMDYTFYASGLTPKRQNKTADASANG